MCLTMTPPLVYIDISLPHEAMTLGEYRRTRTAPPARAPACRRLFGR